MSKPWIFISPASRGIGQALTRHLLRTTRLPILATARSADTGAVKASILSGVSPSPTSPPPEATKKDATEDMASRLHVVQLDVTDEPTMAAAAERAAALFPREAHHLHLGFALPGVLHPERSPAQVRYRDALATLQVNVLGPLMLMKHFGGFLPRKNTDVGFDGGDGADYRYYHNDDGGTGGKSEPLFFPQHATFLTASARVGSVSDNSLGGWYSYRASKAGVNSLAKTFNLHLQAQAKQSGRSSTSSGATPAIAMAYHPGTVKTGLSREFWGGVAPEKLFTAEYAVERMVDVVRTRTPEQGGRCWDWRGEEILP
ncbi:hypothetical protein SLS62_005489 [Diatrype stigma]|uniref:NAD(P)-binding protein n=1 Tax=Diatrype stigma TaxID=117547 RepID=A0AAN9USL0_9PEZI